MQKRHSGTNNGVITTTTLWDKDRTDTICMDQISPAGPKKSFIFYIGKRLPEYKLVSSFEQITGSNETFKVIIGISKISGSEVAIMVSEPVCRF